MNTSRNVRISLISSGPFSSWTCILTILIILLFPIPTKATNPEQAYGVGALEKHLSKMLTPQDSVIIAEENHNILLAINADRLLIPASILKVLTSLAAIDILGETYCFKTEFYQSPERDLIIKGYGDPLMVSEKIAFIAEQISGHIESIKDLVLDDTYFAQPIIIPGRNNSIEPYDALNGAFIVNFNTVNFKQEKGKWMSAEPQTPLLPMVIPKIEDSGLSSGRISIALDNNDGLNYAGKLFSYFFKKANISIKGIISFDQVDHGRDELVLTYMDDSPLVVLIRDLLEYSNNFIANQLLLTMGAAKFGAPATLDKGVRTIMEYCNDKLDPKTVYLREGAGLSRENLITARAMITVLDHFSPYIYLMRHKGRQYYKTGTLKGVSSCAGYMDSRSGGRYRFVVIRNSKGKTTDEVMNVLELYLP